MLRNIYLQQIMSFCSRIQHWQDDLNPEKLKSLNSFRKIERLHKSLKLHQRFMMVIKDNSIPKLHEIVKVAILSKRNLQYIILKLIDAVHGFIILGTAKTRKDLAFIILQYGVLQYWMLYTRP